MLESRVNKFSNWIHTKNYMRKARREEETETK